MNSYIAVDAGHSQTEKRLEERGICFYRRIPYMNTGASFREN